jgi:hypothetical protein
MGHPNINMENAKRLSDLAVAAHKRNAAIRRAKALEPKPPEPPPLPVVVLPAKEPDVKPEDAYRLQRLNQVRIIVSRLDDALLAATDPMTIEKLSRAGHRYSQVEQMLAGRPNPGSRKPSPERPQRREPPRTGLVTDYTGPLAPCPWDPQQPSVIVKVEPITPPSPPPIDPGI